ncbi:MAG: SDR family oxidoreductase [Chromatiales bacterium]|nr:SDR family oxidoreductase [Chromatiales bacterium]
MDDIPIIIAGCGYTGRRLATRCMASGNVVLALVRSRSSLDSLESGGVPVVQTDLDETPRPTPDQGVRYVYMVPPPASGDTDPRIARWLTAISGTPERIVYLSTTGVYGDRGGQTVDEDTPPRPVSDRARRRLDAESRLLDFGASRGVRIVILRVPGIYGPGRLPLQRLQSGQPVPRDGDTGPGNRIHVDDLVSACLASINYDGVHQVFNVGDGNDTSMGEYFRVVARLAGLSAPTQLPLDILLKEVSPAMRSFLTESRWVDVSRMRKELRVAPKYEDLEAGIRDSLEEERRAG